jgi:hypothetical protein
MNKIFDFVKKAATIGNMVISIYVVGWGLLFSVGKPLAYDLIIPSFMNYPLFDWIVTTVFVGFAVAAFLNEERTFTKVILSGYNVAMVIWWWLLESGKFDQVFHGSIDNVILLGILTMTGMIIVNEVSIHKDCGWKFALAALIAYTATCILLDATIVQNPPTYETRTVSVTESRPANFQLVGTPEVGKMTYLFEEYRGSTYSSYSVVGFQYENGTWIYCWPITGDRSNVPWKSEFRIPIRLEDGNTIWGKAWVDEYGVWMDLSVFNKDSKNF